MYEDCTEFPSANLNSILFPYINSREKDLKYLFSISTSLKLSASELNQSGIDF